MKKILCVCIGNGDRSPVMAAVLEMFLKKAGHEITCESAGIHDNTGKGGPAAEFAVTAAKTIGIDLSQHRRRQVKKLFLDGYDLIVCATDEIARVVMDEGVEMSKVYNAQISNPWPVHFPQDYEATFETILGRMGRVAQRYFSQ